ncbi:MAG: DoxX family protein [Flavobacteriaceae bacterium]|nr:DoxX family protein [Flavobacteriaceae bacterium]
MTHLRTILQFFLAAVFLFSAYTKAIAPGFFEILLEQQGLVPNRLYGAWATRAIIALETWLAIGLLLPFYTRLLLRLSFGMLLFFSLHLVYLIAIGNTENCGCFGEMISMSPLESLVKNIVLIGANGFLLQYRYRESKPSWFTWALLPTLFAAAVFIWPVSTKIDEVVAKFPQFEQSSSIDLTRGEYLVAVLNLSCEHCQEAASEITQLQEQSITLPQVVALFFEEGGTTVAEFNALTQSDFPYHMIDVNTFFDLIGSAPPRVYWVEDGEVNQFWDENIGEGIQTTFTP